MKLEKIFKKKPVTKKHHLTDGALLGGEVAAWQREAARSTHSSLRRQARQESGRVSSAPCSRYGAWLCVEAERGEL